MLQQSHYLNTIFLVYLEIHLVYAKASFSSVNWGEKYCIRISVAFRLYLVKIIQILTN
jgi:hypothetical protein